jgi:hypothetical protein
MKPKFYNKYLKRITNQKWLGTTGTVGMRPHRKTHRAHAKPTQDKCAQATHESETILRAMSITELIN